MVGRARTIAHWALYELVTCPWAEPGSKSLSHSGRICIRAGSPTFSNLVLRLRSRSGTASHVEELCQEAADLCQPLLHRPQAEGVERGASPSESPAPSRRPTLSELRTLASISGWASSDLDTGLSSFSNFLCDQGKPLTALATGFSVHFVPLRKWVSNTGSGWKSLCG